MLAIKEAVARAKEHVTRMFELQRISDKEHGS